LSIIPNERLISADSLDLITFGIALQVDSVSQQIDTYSRVGAFWKSAIIRNLQSTINLTYFTSPNAQPRIVPPNSELPIKGWGSYMRIESSAATPLGVVDFECVSLHNAVRNPEK